VTITYQIEPWGTYYRDCQQLWIEHYDEIAVQKDRMEMKPDVASYKALEELGKLQIVVVRDDGRMVGYILSVIRPHLHYANVLCGFEDAYFLSKTHRRGMIGVKLIREAVRHMQAVGVQKVFFMTKAALDMGSIFERLGFDKTDIVYSKWIGAD
jgi:L-amino acid N-acyltransferase YncA